MIRRRATSWLDPDTTDRLLDGQVAPDDAPPGYAEVAAVLQAAPGPSEPDPPELAGAPAFVAALVGAAASADDPAPSVHQTVRRTARLGVGSAVAIGGFVLAVAAAAATGVVLNQDPPRPTTTTTTTSTVVAPTTTVPARPGAGQPPAQVTPPEGASGAGAPVAGPDPTVVPPSVPATSRPGAGSGGAQPTAGGNGKGNGQGNGSAPAGSNAGGNGNGNVNAATSNAGGNGNGVGPNGVPPGQARGHAG